MNIGLCWNRWRPSLPMVVGIDNPALIHYQYHIIIDPEGGDMFETILEGLAIEAILWELTELLAVVTFFSNCISLWLPNHSKYPPIQWLLDMLNKLSLNIYRNANRAHDRLERSTKQQEYDVEEAVKRAIEKERKASKEPPRRAGAKP